MAKKDPYKRIQKRFVEARAAGQGLEYEDLTIEQRERFQNRFNTLAQTVEGRGTIAQRLLGPDAAQEQRRGLRQRIRENLPGTKLPEPGGSPTGDTEEPTTKPLTMRDFRREEAKTSTYRAGTYKTPTSTRAEPKTTVTATTKTSTGGQGILGKIGSGIYGAASKVGQATLDELGYAQRAYVNPVINLAGRTADIIGGRTGSQKFKPLPELSGKEIAIESGVIVTGGLAGKIAGPLVRGTARTALGVTKTVGRAGAPGAASIVASPIERVIAQQTARQQVLQATQRKALGEQVVTRYGSALSDLVPSRVTPAGSKVTRTTPATSGVTRSTVPGATAPKVTKPKVTKPKVTKPKVTQTKVTTQSVEQATEEYAPGFNKVAGEMEMRSTEVTPLPATTRATTASLTKQPKKATKVDVTPEPVKAPEPVPTAPGKQWWKEETIPKSQREFLEDLSAEQRGDIYDVTPRKEPKVKSTRQSKAKPISVEKLEQPSSPVKEVKTTKATQKKSVTPQPAKAPEAKQSVQITKEEEDILRLYPSSAKAQEISARQRGVKPFVPGKGKAELPTTVEKSWVPERSSSEILFEAMNVPKPKEPLGWTPKKVTKLPKRDNPALDKLENKGSQLFRMYDQGIGSGKRPGGSAGEINTGLLPSAEFDDIVSGAKTTGFDLTKSQEEALRKQINETLEQESAIRRGTAINPRLRRTSTRTVIEGTMEMPTTMSSGSMKTLYGPQLPSVGKSAEQRLAEYYRSLYPQARSNAEARKLYARDRGLDPSSLRPDPVGSPLGAKASRSPVTEMEVSRPVKFEEVTTIVGGKKVTTKKPTKFVKERVKAVETLFGTVPVEEMATPTSQRWINDPSVIQGKRLEAKASKMKTEATRAAQLRARGIQGEARGREFQKVKQATEEGKAFQVRFDEMLNKPASPTGEIRSTKKTGSKKRGKRKK
jgi:hypothetical protein